MGERIVIEARQSRRIEEERQQMANNQVKAHQQHFASFELFQCFIAQNPAPAATPAATFAAVPTATPTMRCSKEVEELRKRQEELMEAAIKENEEKEARVLRKNEERVEGLRRENLERKEKIGKECKEAEKKLRREYKEKEERLQKEKEEALAALTTRNKEKEEQVKRENSEMDAQLRRENKQLVEEQKRKDEESFALLQKEAKDRMTKIIVRMTVNQEQNEKAARKRKADQIETNKQPAAPECPVCLLKNKLLLTNFSFYPSLLQVCLDEMAPPTKIFHCVNGHHICETCK